MQPGLRERLAQLLQSEGYSPANEAELARRLGLQKKDRPAFSSEIKKLVDSGSLERVQGDRLKIRSSSPSPASRGPSPVARNRQSREPQRSGGHGKPRDFRKPTQSLPGGLEGKIGFRAGGSAYVVLSASRNEPAVQIAPDDTGVALPGDLVEVQIYPGAKGRNPGEKVGRVVRVITRARLSLVGNLKREGRSFLVSPDDPKFIYDIAVQDPAKSGILPVPEPGDKVTVTLDEWRRRTDLITGVITGRLGKTHEPRAELLGVYVKYNLEPEFPAQVRLEADELPDRVLASELEGRLDYRTLPVFTIDPDDAKDFDDALSIEALPSGDTRVGVHIADVSAYVKPGTALDREAQKRGNSTYLVGTVVPMLPEKLSNGLCSLVEAQDRLCKAVFLTFSPVGALKDTAYANTVIKSRKRLTYKQAYALLFQDSLAAIRALPLPPKHQTGSTGRALSELSDRELTELQGWVRDLWAIASGLRRDRMANGSLDLDMPETKVFVDKEGYADRLERIEHDESHQLIEEFMLAANQAVAHLTRTSRLPSLYRVHDEPEPEKLEEYRELLSTFGIRVGDLTLKNEVARLLVTLQRHPQGYTLRTQFLRSLKKACYRATPDGHYGLSKKDYAHFTSPIRRYADLVVHRVLGFHLAKRHGAGGKPPYDAKSAEALAEHLSLTEINSTEAERESVKIKILEFFERQLDKKPKDRFAAIVTEARRNGLFVELTESLTFGFVSAESLTDDVYVLDPAGTALVGRKRKKRYTVGTRFEVEVARVDRFQRLIDFKPAEPASTG